MKKYKYLFLKQINEIVFIFGTEEDLSKYKDIYWSDVKFNDDNSNATIHIAYSCKNIRSSFEAKTIDNVQAKIQQKYMNHYGVDSMINNNLRKYGLSRDKFIELK